MTREGPGRRLQAIASETAAAFGALAIALASGLGCGDSGDSAPAGTPDPKLERAPDRGTPPAPDPEDEAARALLDADLFAERWAGDASRREEILARFRQVSERFPGRAAQESEARVRALEESWAAREVSSPADPDGGTEPVEPSDPEPDGGTEPVEPSDPEPDGGTEPAEPSDPDSGGGPGQPEPADLEELLGPGAVVTAAPESYGADGVGLGFEYRFDAPDAAVPFREFQGCRLAVEDGLLAIRPSEPGGKGSIGFPLAWKDRLHGEILFSVTGRPDAVWFGLFLESDNGPRAHIKFSEGRGVLEFVREGTPGSPGAVLETANREVHVDLDGGATLFGFNFQEGRCFGSVKGTDERPAWLSPAPAPGGGAVRVGFEWLGVEEIRVEKIVLQGIARADSVPGWEGR